MGPPGPFSESEKIMFQIFDCNGRPVGRPEGYKRHNTALRLAHRAGRINTAIWAAYHAQENPGELGRRVVYRIEWAEPIDSPVLASETKIECFRDTVPLAPIRAQLERIAGGNA